MTTTVVWVQELANACFVVSRQQSVPCAIVETIASAPALVATVQGSFPPIHFNLSMSVTGSTLQCDKVL